MSLEVAKYTYPLLKEEQQGGPLHVRMGRHYPAHRILWYHNLYTSPFFLAEDHVQAILLDQMLEEN